MQHQSQENAIGNEPPISYNDLHIRCTLVYAAPMCTKRMDKVKHLKGVLCKAIELCSSIGSPHLVTRVGTGNSVTE